MADDKQPAAAPASTPAAPAAPAAAPAADAKPTAAPATSASSVPARQAKVEPAPAPVANAKPGHNSKPASLSIFDDIDDDEPEVDDTAGKQAATTGENDGSDAEADGDKAAKPAKDAGAWPEDWREKFAGGDEKLLKRLARFQSPEGFVKSYKALEQKLSSGEFKRALPEDATPEQKAIWRKENGIPEKPDEYAPPKITGHEWTEADKPVLASFAEVALEADLPKAAFEKVTAWYAGVVQAQKEAQTEIDRADRMNLEDQLRTKWQGDYRPTLTLISRLMKDTEALPAGLGERIATARTADGHRLINTPEMISFLAEMARDRYGEGAMIRGEQAKALGERKHEIEKIMREDINRYYREKNADGKTLEAEYREILSRENGGGGRRGRAA